MNFCTIAIEAVGQEKAGDGESEIPMGPKCRKGAKLSRSRDGGKDLTNKLIYVLLDMFSWDTFALLKTPFVFFALMSTKFGFYRTRKPYDWINWDTYAT